VGGDAFSEGGNTVLCLFLVLRGIPIPVVEGLKPLPGPNIVEDRLVAGGGGQQRQGGSVGRGPGGGGACEVDDARRETGGRRSSNAPRGSEVREGREAIYQYCNLQY
jgi:hypothetical protein